MKYVSPSVKETAFNCPHCGALAKQTWYSVHADRMKKDDLPTIVGLDFDLNNFPQELRDTLRDWVQKSALGRPFFEANSKYRSIDVNNMWLSDCFNCNEPSVWIYDKLVYPQKGEAPPANPDLPADVRRDYDEASTILDLSPRGSAALLRLGIQKLCKELGQSGKNINEDIKALVATGLDTRIQRALDAVRVIGNEAVHPGQLDLRDDRAMAESLFRLMNLIADRMISEPKHVDEVYNSLPERARSAIEKRDKSLD